MSHSQVWQSVAIQMEMFQKLLDHEELVMKPVMICIEASSFGVVWSQSRKMWFITCLLPFLQMEMVCVVKGTPSVWFGDLDCSGAAQADSPSSQRGPDWSIHRRWRRVDRTMWQVFFDQHQLMSQWSQKLPDFHWMFLGIGIVRSIFLYPIISYHIPASFLDPFAP